MQHHVYSIFGDQIALKNGAGVDITTQPIVNTAFGYAGRERDSESGFLYLRARYYFPAIGRFVQMDPAAGQLAMPNTVTQRYSYAGNNPAMLRDPSGRSFLGDVFEGALNIATEVFTRTPLTIFWDLNAMAAGALGIEFGNTVHNFLNSAPFRAVETSMIIGAAAAFTGGAAAGAWAAGAISGTLIGAAAGAATGGVLGGLFHKQLGEQDFWGGFKKGAAIGALAGAGAGVQAVKASESVLLASNDSSSYMADIIKTLKAAKCGNEIAAASGTAFGLGSLATSAFLGLGTITLATGGIGLIGATVVAGGLAYSSCDL